MAIELLLAGILATSQPVYAANAQTPVAQATVQADLAERNQIMTRGYLAAVKIHNWLLEYGDKQNDRPGRFKFCKTKSDKRGEAHRYCDSYLDTLTFADKQYETYCIIAENSSISLRFMVAKGGGVIKMEELSIPDLTPIYVITMPNSMTVAIEHLEDLVKDIEKEANVLVK